MAISGSLHHHHLKRHEVTSSSSPYQETTISDLPEDIILHLATSLKLRDIVNFSLVSKQWIHLPACLQNIHLDEGMFKVGSSHHCLDNKDTFIVGVNQFLNTYTKLRNSSMVLANPVSLHTFRIFFCLDKHSSIHVDAWIRMAIADYSVSTLVVATQCHFLKCNGIIKSHVERYVFPWLTLPEPPPTMLKKLYLQSGVFGCYIATEWPSLETLDLFDMILTQDDMDRIIRYFPRLQRIVFQHCKVPDKLTFAGGPLTCLMVLYCREVKEIKVLDAGKLREFAFKGRSNGLDLHNAHQVKNVTFGTCSASGMDYIFQKLRMNLPGMQSLSIYIFCDSLPPLSQICGGMSSFFKLEELKINSHPACGFCLQTIEEVLKACPVLRRLEMVPPCTAADIGSVTVQHQHHRHKCLKFIKLSGFCGSFANVELAKFLVEVSEEVVCQIVIQQNVDDIYYRVLRHTSGWHGQQEYKAIRSLLLNLMKRGELLFFGETLN